MGATICIQNASNSDENVLFQEPLQRSGRQGCHHALPCPKRASFDARSRHPEAGSCIAQSSATEDQASDHDNQSRLQRTDFNLDVQETPPTPDQLTSILDYLGPSKAGTVVEEATGTSDALRKFNAKQQAFQRPVTVDWNNGRAVVGDDESELMRLVRTLPKG